MAEKISNSSQRLKEMMAAFSLKQSDIVARTGITKSALSNYIHGTREPRQDQISKIADPYGINPAWLMGYDVPMSMLETTISKLKELTDVGMRLSGVTDEEIELLESFRGLNEESKRQLVLMLAFLKDQNKDK